MRAPGSSPGLYVFWYACGRSASAHPPCSQSSSLLRWDAGGILGGMPTRRSAETTPDRVSTPPPEGARPPIVPTSKAEPDNLAPQPRYLLPSDLAGALKRLDDAELDTLLAAVTTEAERRGRRPPRSATERPPSAAMAQPPSEHDVGSLSTGKLNAVRAAFKAGLKASAIAREFGISQSEVRKALAAQRRSREAFE